MPKKITYNVKALTNGLFRFCESSLFLKIAFAWFSLQSVWMALATSFGIAPDERYHYFYTQLFVHNGWSPIINNQTGYYFLGEAVRLPFFLYHYLLSLPLHLFYNASFSIQLLRLINVAFGVLTLFVMVRIADLLKISKLARNLSVFMLANTLMFVFLSASISYDNLFNLVALLAIYFLLLNLQAITYLRLASLKALVITGLLIKINFLPIAIIIVVILIFKYTLTSRQQLKKLMTSAKDSKQLNIAVSLLLIVLVGLFVQRYVYNYVKYRAIAPNCPKVQTIQNCRQSAIFVRTENLNSSKRPAANKNPIKYLDSWSKIMLKRTYGIFGHKQIEPDGLILMWAALFVVLGLGATVLMISRKDGQLLVILVVIGFYEATLLYSHVRTYLRYGSISFTVQGRYLFAVLPLIYLVFNHYILKFSYFKNIYLKFAYLSLTIIIFAISCLPIYLTRTDASWHRAITTSYIKYQTYRFV